MRKCDGVSPVLGVIFMIAVVIVASQLMFSYLPKKVVSKPPLSATVQGRLLEEYVSGYGWETQVVELIHVAGDPISVKDLRIGVEIYRKGNLEKHEIFWGFPCNPREIKYEGDDIVSRSNRDAGYFGELRRGSDGIWSAGEKIGFRIKKSGFTLESGDEVVVRLIHIPSELVIVEQRLKVVER